MASLKYTVIESNEQYNDYSDHLEKLLESGLNNDDDVEEYKLLTLLIKDWDEKKLSIRKLDPVELLKSLMEDHNLNQSDLVEIAGVGKSYISEILNYKKKMSSKVIRNIANHFKIRQDALNRPYKLQVKETKPVI